MKNVLNEEFKSLNKKAAKATLEAKLKIEDGLINQAKDNLVSAGDYDLTIARFLEQKGSIDLAVEYYISSGSSFLNAGENDKATAVFRSTREIKKVSPDLTEEIGLLLDEAESRKNYDKLTIRDKKNIEALMGALYEKFGFIGGRGTIMKIYHLISIVAGRYGHPTLLMRGRVSYSPVFYKQINDFIKRREETELLERDPNHHLIPNPTFIDYLIAEKNIFLSRLERIDINLRTEVEKKIDYFGDFIMKDWEEFEELSLGISRRKHFRELI